MKNLLFCIALFASITTQAQLKLTKTNTPQTETIALATLKNITSIELKEKSINSSIPIESIQCTVFHKPSSSNKIDPEEITYNSNSENSKELLMFIFKKATIGSRIYIENASLIFQDGTSQILDNLVVIVR